MRKKDTRIQSFWHNFFIFGKSNYNVTKCYFPWNCETHSQSHFHTLYISMNISTISKHNFTACPFSQLKLHSQNTLYPSTTLCPKDIWFTFSNIITALSFSSSSPLSSRESNGPTPPCGRQPTKGLVQQRGQPGKRFGQQTGQLGRSGGRRVTNDMLQVCIWWNIFPTKAKCIARGI